MQNLTLINKLNEFILIVPHNQNIYKVVQRKQI